MKRYGITAIILSLGLISIACASKQSKTQAASNIEYHPSQELIELDAKLDALSDETDALKKDYEVLQKGVLSRLKFDEPVKKSSKRLDVSINANNILVVNEELMSKNDFLNYIETALPALCNPNPTLSINRQANYDNAAWVLEELYSRGCTQIDIK